MKIRNAILVAVALLVLGLGGALWWLYASRDALIERAIERYGPQLTGVSVKVGGVKLEPLDGTGAIRGLVVGNPPGYHAPQALSLGEMRLAVEPKSLTADVVHVKELALDAPRQLGHLLFPPEEEGTGLLREGGEPQPGVVRIDR